MSLLFNMLSRFVIALLPRSRRLWVNALCPRWQRATKQHTAVATLDDIPIRKMKLLSEAFQAAVPVDRI